VTTDATLAALKQQSENYLETAIAQAVMDQILVHMLLASHPESLGQKLCQNYKR